jgi:hypothetical protein
MVVVMVIMVLLPMLWHGMVWCYSAGRDGTVGTTVFTDYPVWCGLAVAFVIVSCSPSGIVVTVREQVAVLRSWVAFLGHSIADLDPRSWGPDPW